MNDTTSDLPSGKCPVDGFFIGNLTDFILNTTQHFIAFCPNFHNFVEQTSGILINLEIVTHIMKDYVLLNRLISCDDDDENVVENGLSTGLAFFSQNLRFKKFSERTKKILTA